MPFTRSSVGAIRAITSSVFRYGAPCHVAGKTMPGARMATHYGRPGVPTDQALIESFIGHVKAQWPHLERITDPGVLAAELELVRIEFNTVRLHAGLSYVTPDDEHEGRGPAIRQARRDGLERARRDRIAYRRNLTRNRT